MAHVRGVLGSGDVPQLKPDVAAEVALLDVNRYPLLAILTNAGKDPVTGTGESLKKKVCHNHKFSFYTGQFQERWDAVNNGAGYAASATSVVVDNGAYFTINDIILIPRTGERMQVTVIATNTLTVTRSVGDTAAAALVNNDPILIAGNAFGQGALRAKINTIKDVEDYNYTQIFKKSVGVTGTHKQEDNWTGDTLDAQRRKKGIEHYVDIEKAFLFGERGTGTDDQSKTCFYSDGILAKISTYAKDEAASTLTEDEFETFLGDYVFKSGSVDKYLLASSRVISAINKFARDDLRTVPKEKVFGLALVEYFSPHGHLYIVKEPLLEGAIYAGYGIAIDMAQLAYRFLDGRDTKLETNVQANDEDSQIDQYLTECGLQMSNEKCFAILKGVTVS